VTRLGEPDQDSELNSQQDPIKGLCDLYNTCLTYRCFSAVFKQLVIVVLPKSNKADYFKTKSYRPIVLLNCLGKLLEKVVAT
jgi:hypothetical protein